mmetsp:Transcript_26416/g.47909  ORF Transcript_26416/g.47909 Transcript_26416/m.47909 type:complete len:983 (-) Transcript_26416:1528-4476(-)
MVMRNEQLFRRQVNDALKSVQKILNLTRTPRYAADSEESVYEDKFGLAEFLTNVALAAQLNTLERMGLTKDKLQELFEIVHKEQRSVTLRFEAHETCAFLDEKIVTIESPRQEVLSMKIEETKSEDATSATTTNYERKVVTKVTEYRWNVHVEYTLVCFAGSDAHDNPVVLQSRASSTILTTTGNKEAPVPKRKDYAPMDVSLTWLLQSLTLDHVCHFRIDRSKVETRTPRRNEEIDQALEYFKNMAHWSHQFRDFFLTQVERNILGSHHSSDLASRPSSFGTIDTAGVFVPVLPLMESRSTSDETEEVPPTTLTVSLRETNGKSPLLSLGDIDCFLKEQCRSLDEVSSSLEKTFGKDEEQSQGLLTGREAVLYMLCQHLVDLEQHLRDGVDSIEQMLHNQIVSAIGKEVQPKDFQEFVRFHNQKIFHPNYAPKPFCYAIRRPNRYPVGVISIEDDGEKEPIETIVRHILGGDTSPPMFIPINAATRVEFTGERYLHAWIRHRFASDSNPSQFKLIARARQFSSFLLLVGTIGGPDRFDPKDAIILQNKDEVLIPILLNELATAKEFKDAISSLSPEQQQFAKSFRGMQLESSVFGVCVIQLKPQLEALLGLPPDALTKEIGLCQDLLSLFIEYQIPSDLLSFDGPSDAPLKDKVTVVKGYAESVQTVIAKEKTKQMEEEMQRTDMRAELNSTSGLVPMLGGGGAFGTGNAPPSGFQRQSAAPFGDQSFGQQPQSASYFGDMSGSAPSAPGRRMKLQSVERSMPPPMFKQAEMAEMAYEEDFCDYDESEEDCMPDDEEQTHLERSPSEDTEETMDFHLPSMGRTSDEVDFTMIPKQLDSTFEKYDKDNALHATKIKLGDVWSRMRQANLLVVAAESTLEREDQKTEKQKAFDLLDALSRSGSLPIACAELHVVLCVTHCFEKTVMGTVIEDSINPIEKVDASTMLIASTIHNVSVDELHANGKHTETSLAPSVTKQSTGLLV